MDIPTISEATFDTLSNNLTDLFAFVELSQEALCEMIEKLRLLRTPAVFDEMEELVDGTFDQISMKHKELRKCISILRESWFRCKQSPNATVCTAASTSSQSSPVCNGTTSAHPESQASTSTATPTVTSKPQAGVVGQTLSSLNNFLNTSYSSSMDDRLMIDESTTNCSENPIAVKAEMSSQEFPPTWTESRIESKTSLNQTNNNRMIVDEIDLSDIPSTSVRMDTNISDLSNLADDSVWGHQKIGLTPVEVELMLQYEIPLECCVEIEQFNAQIIIASEKRNEAVAKRAKRACSSKRNSEDLESSALSRLIDNTRRILRDRGSAKRKQRCVEAESESSDDAAVLDPKKSKLDQSGVEKKAEMRDRRNSSELKSTDRTRSQAAKEKQKSKRISVSSELSGDEGSGSSIEHIGNKNSNGGGSNADKANGPCIVIDEDELSDEEFDNIENVTRTRRPVTRSRVKDEADKLLTKSAVILDDSDFDNDSDYKTEEKFHKKQSKAVITRKRVYSSSSSEGATILNHNDLDSGRSDKSQSDLEVVGKKNPRSSGRLQSKATKSKKKRAKIAFDSDEERSIIGSASEGGDEPNESTNHFRSRKMISKNKLAKSTIDAEKAENERRERLKQKQKEFNGIEMSQAESGEVEWNLTGLERNSDKSTLAPKLKSLTLDKDEKSDPPQPVEVHPALVQLLKPHQAEGLVFMYNSVFESISRLDADETFGGILAHCMGLGKTFQVIAFLHTVMSHPKLSEVVRHVMVVGPKNVVNNWAKEFTKWLYDVDTSLDTIMVYNMALYTDNRERKEVMREWHKSKKPSVLIISYELFRNLTESEEDKPKTKKSKLKKPKKKTQRERKLEAMKEDFRKYLQDPGPDLVICDEGHKLKSDETSVFKTMSKIRTSKRLCLTGTPMQNNLSEYYTMISFVKPGLLGTKSEFANRFSNIISRGQTIDASILEVRAMKRRCHVLYDYLREVVHRRDYRVLIQTIPPKQEYVIYVRMTERQCALYRGFLQKFCASAELTMRKRLLADYHIFSRIWTHPFALVLHERDVERRQLLNEEEEFVVSDEEEAETESISGNSNEEAIIDEPSTSTAIPTRRHTRQNPTDLVDGDKLDDEVMSGWYSDLNLISKDDEFAFHLGNKLILLQQIIKKCEEIGDKLLVFSHSLEALRIIRRMLDYLGGEGLWFVDGHEALRAEGEEWGWKNGVDYLVIDGSVSNKGRDYIQDKFNDPLNLRARLMLISTQAGSLGTNLVTANRVVIFDASWNPSHDTQAMFRVYRYGQVKPVYIYRLIAQGTMEERIYKRQVTKESTARRVTEEAQIQRHFSGSDLYELYQFDPSMEGANSDDHQARLAPAKDRLLADVIQSHGGTIVSYLQHDSLFDEVEDEKLTESERLAAWEDYEREKRAVPAPTISMNNTNHTGAVPPVMPQSLPAHLAVLPNNSTELMAITSGARSDHLYRACFDVSNMSHDAAIRVLFVKRLLDRLLPFIPNDRRGGINEFDSYFINIIKTAIVKGHSPSQLLETVINVFRTTVTIARDVPKCMQLILAFNRIAPGLFPAPTITL